MYKQRSRGFVYTMKTPTLLNCNLVRFCCLKQHFLNLGFLWNCKEKAPVGILTNYNAFEAILITSNNEKKLGDKESGRLILPTVNLVSTVLAHSSSKREETRGPWECGRASSKFLYNNIQGKRFQKKKNRFKMD